MQQKKIHRNFPGIIYVLANIKGGFLLIDLQDKLENPWTPKQIAGRAKLDKLYNISFKTIYRAIDNGKEELMRIQMGY